MMFTLNSSDNVTSYNKNFSRLMKEVFDIPIKLDKPFMERVPLVTKESYAWKILALKRHLGEVYEFELPLFDKQKNEKWFQIFEPYRIRRRGKGRCISYDITDRKEIDNSIRLAEGKEILLQEVHHRVKNNLQVISSLMNLQKLCV